MAKRVTEQDPYSGKVVTGKAPKKARQGDFDIAIVDTRGKRIIRNLFH